MRDSKPDFYRKFDERSEELSNNRKNMGIIETVIKYRSEEAREEGREEGKRMEAFLKDFEHLVKTILKPLRKGYATNNIADLLDIDHSVVKEINDLITPSKEKVIWKKIKNFRSKIISEYTLESLKVDMIQLLLSFKFSEKVIGKILKLPLGLIRKIKKEMKNTK